MPIAQVSVEISYILYTNVVTVHEVHKKICITEEKSATISCYGSFCGLPASFPPASLHLPIEPIDKKNIQLLRGFWVGISRKSAGFSTWLLSKGFAQSSSTGTPIALCLTSKVRCKSFRACKIYTV